MHRQIWEALLLATFISLRLPPSAFSRETILRDSEIRHSSIGRTIVPMAAITQLLETGWDGGFQPEGMCQHQGHFLSPNTLTSVVSYSLSNEPRNERIGSKR